MDQAMHNEIVSFIWGVADDVLRNLFKRGKYPDVILPICVIQRMDAVLEPTKAKVLETKKMLDMARITEQRAVRRRVVDSEPRHGQLDQFYTDTIHDKIRSSTPC